MYKGNIVITSMTSEKKIDKLFSYLSQGDIRVPNLLIYGANDDENYKTFIDYIDSFSPNNTTKRLRINMLSGYDISIKKGNLHFELDMDMITNTKVWVELYDHIRDIIIAKKMNRCILLLKNFQRISLDILETFYSMLEDTDGGKLSFVILTRSITFINQSIQKRFVVVKPKCKSGNSLHESYKIVCDHIVKFIVTIDDINYHDIRTNAYKILTNNLNQNDCVTYIIDELIRGKYVSITREFLDNITLHINGINKNYRSIYHLEGLLVYLIIHIHGLQDCPS